MKRGFTLIELLAVIVILAIIALIAVPVVVNIINDSKKSSEKETIKLYIDTVQKAVGRKQLENTSFNPTTCTIKSTGDLLCGEVEVKIEMKGTIPSEGTLEFSRGKIITGENILLNSLYYQIQNGNISEGTKTKVSTTTSIMSKIKSAVGSYTGTCTITGTNKITCGTNETTITNLGNKTISGGTIIFTNGEVTSYKNLNINGTYYHKKAGETETTTNNKVYLCTKVSAASTTSITKGDKYTCDVNDTDTFNFYVLTESVDGKVNMIMDRNICNDGSVTYTSTNYYCNYKWYSGADNNTYGPTTVMAELYAGTKDWDNVDDMVMNYTDENNTNSDTNGYTSIITNNGVTTITGKPTANTTTVGTSSKPLKARLPKESEIITAGCTTSSGSCPVWLIEYMAYSNVSNDKYSMNNNNEDYQNIYGYWLLSSFQGYSSSARYVGCNGFVNSSKPTYDHHGARPVITVSVDDLSN